MPHLPLLSVRHVCKTFALKNKASLMALDDISLDIHQGDFLVLLGPSGSGKSTLLNILAGLEKPDRGEIYLNNENITLLPPGKRQMSMVFQNYILYPHMNVHENLSYPLKMKKIPQKTIETEIEKISQDLDINHLLDRRPDQLSGGQKQRIAIAHSMIKKPQIYLFDEPFSNLDARLKDKMRAQMRKLHQNLGATIIYVTHDQIEAMSLATSLAIIHKGKIIQIGSPRDIYTQPTNVFTADFLGFPAINLCTVSYQNPGLYLEGQCLCKQFKLHTNTNTETNYLLAIRPEHIMAKAQDQDNLTLSLIPETFEYLGNMNLLHAKIGKQSLCLCLDDEERENIRPGIKRDFYICRQKILIYSKKDETLLGKLSNFC